MGHMEHYQQRVVFYHSGGSTCSLGSMQQIATDTVTQAIESLGDIRGAMLVFSPYIEQSEHFLNKSDSLFAEIVTLFPCFCL